MADNTNDSSRNQDPLRPMGNRPADNARQATPASLLAQMNWQGGDSAQDFLGLNDPEPSAPVAVANPEPMHSSALRTASPQAGSSWLMDANPQVQRDLNARVEPEEPLDVEDGSGESALRAPAVLDASWSEPQEPRGSRKHSMVAVCAGLAIVAAAGLAFVKFKSGSGKAASGDATLARASDVDAAAAQPKPAAQSPMQAPKPPAAASAANGAPASTRVALDRRGNALPAVVVAESEEPGDAAADPTPPNRVPPQLKPRFEPIPVASKPVPETQVVVTTPQELTPANGSVAETPGESAAVPSPEATSPELIANTPAPAPGRPAFRPLEPSGTPERPAEGTRPSETQPQATPPLIAEASTTQAPSVQTPPALEPPAPIVAAHKPALGAPLSDVTATPGETVESRLPKLPAPPIAGAGDAASGPGESGVRVIDRSSTPVGDALNARPAVDEHRYAVPTQLAGVTPAPGVDPAATSPATEPSGSATVQAPATANRQGTLDARDVLLPPSPQTGVRVAQAKDLLTVWDGDEIPMEHIATKPKLLTPGVGDVRIKLKTKDIFEGKLYAIGENAVWIEGPYGRMSLDSARIASVEKIVAEGSAAAGKGSNASLHERVRVKTPGGQVFGKVVSKDESKITLLTDAGLTLTVEASAVEYLQPSPALIIKKEAPKK